MVFMPSSTQKEVPDRLARRQRHMCRKSGRQSKTGLLRHALRKPVHTRQRAQRDIDSSPSNTYEISY